MTRIAPLDPAAADAATQATLAGVKAKLGMVPNLLATFARSPATLNAYLAFSDALSKGALTARQREIVALATAQTNECHYCLSAHTLLGKNAGLSAEAVLAARKGTASDAKDAAIAGLAKAVASSRGHVADADLAAARAAGLDDGLIVEIVGQVTLNVLTNFTNNVAKTAIDFPVVDVAA